MFPLQYISVCLVGAKPMPRVWMDTRHVHRASDTGGRGGRKGARWYVLFTGVQGSAVVLYPYLVIRKAVVTFGHVGDRLLSTHTFHSRNHQTQQKRICVTPMQKWKGKIRHYGIKQMAFSVGTNKHTVC